MTFLKTHLQIQTCSEVLGARTSTQELRQGCNSAMTHTFAGWLSDLGKPLSSFFPTWAKTSQGISSFLSPVSQLQYPLTDDSHQPVCQCHPSSCCDDVPGATVSKRNFLGSHSHIWRSSNDLTMQRCLWATQNISWGQLNASPTKLPFGQPPRAVPTQWSWEIVVKIAHFCRFHKHVVPWTWC